MEPFSAEKSTIGRLRPLPVPGWIRLGFRGLRLLSPRAAVWVANRLFFTPPRPPIRPGDRQVLAAGRPFSLTVRDEKVVGWEWGVGAPILIVHGWGGYGGQLAAFVAPLVDAGHRVIALDLPGHGASAGRQSSLVHFAQALAAAGERFGPFAGIVAHSFGAAATTYALSQGLVAARVVFLAPPSRFDSFWARFRKALGVPESLWLRMVIAAERRLALSFAAALPVALAPGMRAPLLIVHAPDDREVPFEEGVELGQQWPQARLVEMPGGGHLRILRDPQAVGQALAFLTHGAEREPEARAVSRTKAVAARPAPAEPRPLGRERSIAAMADTARG
jgi:pimeloyl-ACP methyl ester carboxylesterase